MFPPLLCVGLVFNPATPLDHAKYVLDKIDIILLMSVNPGFGGQSFIPSTIQKLREARKMIDESGYDIRLEVTLIDKYHGSSVIRNIFCSSTIAVRTWQHYYIKPQHQQGLDKIDMYT